MPKLLFVCTANRCRSPMAERLFIRQLENHHENISQWQVTSAGTWTVDGIPPDEKLISAMDEFDVNIRDHRSRMLTENIINEQDLVLVMENNHLEVLRFEFPKQSNNMHMLSEMISRNFNIPDPFSQDLKTYFCVTKQIDNILSEGYSKIIENSK